MKTGVADGNSVEIRCAREEDIPVIAELLKGYAKEKILLGRSEAEIQKHLFSFWVAQSRTGEVVGSVCLRRYSDDLYEVRSLAVSADWVGKRIGSRLVGTLIEKLSEHPGARLFALTLRAHFFMNLGFKLVSKHTFPEKIWNDCVSCAKRSCCDEDAVLFERD